MVLKLNYVKYILLDSDKYPVVNVARSDSFESILTYLFKRGTTFDWTAAYT